MMRICRCCNQDTLEEDGGNFEICPNCNWEDDKAQSDDEWLWGGANPTCLAVYRDIYKMIKVVMDDQQRR